MSDGNSLSDLQHSNQSTSMSINDSANDDLGLDVEWEVSRPVSRAGVSGRGYAGFEAVRALSRRLRGSDAPRTKTGLVFWPASLWRDVHGVAAALDATPVSLAARLLQRLPANARAVPLDVESLFAEVSAVADERQGGDVAWVFDVDVLLAKLPEAERERFWEAAFDRLPHRARAVLLALPLLEQGQYSLASAGALPHDSHSAGGVEGGPLPGHPLGPSRVSLLRWREAGRLELIVPGSSSG
jgi:hypothetical protein